MSLITMWNWHSKYWLLFCSGLYEGWTPLRNLQARMIWPQFADHNCYVSLYFFMPFPSEIVLNLCITPNKFCYVRSHTFTVKSHMLTWYFCLSCSVRQSQSTSGVDIDAEPVTIMHPDVDKAESLIRNAWNEVKLVAD